MRAIIQLIFTLLWLLIKVSKPGGTKGLISENLCLRQQLIILTKGRARSPNLTNMDRLIFGLCSALINTKRLKICAILLKPATILKIHQAFVKRKYNKLFSNKGTNKKRVCGPSEELIKLVLEYKHRNPIFGYLRIAMQVSNQFGLEINKDVVRRILNKYYHGGIPDNSGPSWLTFLGCTKDSLWSVDLFRSESIHLKSYWIMLVMDLWSRRIVGFAVHRGAVCGVDLCCMFNSIISDTKLPKRMSSDNDPIFRYHRWQANLRILEIEEIKTVPYTPISHPFIERLIGIVRQDFLNKILFWNSNDLQKKLNLYQQYYNQFRSHSANDSMSPNNKCGHIKPAISFDKFKWEKHLRGLVQLPCAAA